MAGYVTPSTPAAVRFAAALAASRQAFPGLDYRQGVPAGWQPNSGGAIFHGPPISQGGGARFIGPPIPRGNSVNKHTYALMQWLRG